MFLKTLLAVSFIITTSLAALPSGTVTCGSDRYSVSAIEAAIDAGVQDMDSGNLPGQFDFRYPNPNRTYLIISTRRLSSPILRVRYALYLRILLSYKSNIVNHQSTLRSIAVVMVPGTRCVTTLIISIQ